MTSLDQLTHPDHPAVVIARRVKPGQEEAFLAWAAGIQAVMAEQPGFRAYQAIPPVDEGSRSWHFIFTFEDDLSLRTWLQSDLRAQWQARSESLTEGPGSTRVVRSLETLLGIPPDHGATPPWKAALLTELGLAPVVFLVGLLLHRVPPFTGLAGLGLGGLALQVVVSTSICVALMTWLVMPAVLRAFRTWLYPGK